MVQVAPTFLVAVLALVAAPATAQGPSIPYDGIETGAPGPFDCRTAAATPREKDRCDTIARIAETAAEAQRCLISFEAQGCETLRADIHAARATILDLTGPQATAGTAREALAREEAGSLLFPDGNGAQASRPRSEATRFDE